MHYIYKFYILLFLQQFIYNNKATTIKKSIERKKEKKRKRKIFIFIVYLVSTQY